MSVLSGPTAKLCTLRIHDDKSSAENAIISLEHFKELGFTIGDLVEVVAVKPRASDPAVHDFQDEADFGNDDLAVPGATTQNGTSTVRTRRHSSADTLIVDEKGSQVPLAPDIDIHKSYAFKVVDFRAEVKTRFRDVPISIAQTIATAFGFRRGMQVLIRSTTQAYNPASHVEIKFKDEYLSRSDMWRLTISELSMTTVYRGQKLLFLGTIKGTVSSVWHNGKRKKSGFFNGDTKPIFRSESARFIIFIQMSREMWNFDTEASGEIMFDKVINGFLPELFKNWQLINARHLVSIVMFARLEYDEDVFSRSSSRLGRLGASAAAEAPRDFYRVVVSEMASGDWIKILNQLKTEFRSFQRDISTQSSSVFGRRSENTGDESHPSEPEYMIVGKPTLAYKGNILEAINLASSQFSRDYIDRDLVRTGISVIVITAGSGVHEVDYGMLKLTTDTLIGSGIGIDLVCLSPMPLHSVPLFKYRNPERIEKVEDINRFKVDQLDPEDSTPRQFRIGSLPSSQSQSSTPKARDKFPDEPVAGEWSYAIPHWVDVSFWRGPSSVRSRTSERATSDTHVVKPATAGKEFNMRCRMYELQMMGVMENEMNHIIVPAMHNSHLHPWHKIELSGRPMLEKERNNIHILDHQWMDQYDDLAFKPLRQKQEAEDKAGESNRKRTQRLAVARKDPVQEAAIPDRSSLLSPSLRPTTGFSSPGWTPRDRNSSIIPSRLKHKSSNSSMVSSTDTVISKRSDFSRQISFGKVGITGSKAELSSNVTTMGTNVKMFRSKKAAGEADNGDISNFTNQFRAALNRSSSQQPASTKATASRPLVTSPISAQPINIGSKHQAPHHSRQKSDEHTSSSSITPVGSQIRRVTSNRSPDKPPPTSAITFAAASVRTLGIKPSVLSSSLEPIVPRLLSPTSAISPWLVNVNPCNPTKNIDVVGGQFGRWQHVFPRQLSTSVIKWKSLCSPASVPLTNEQFPTAEQLRNEYHQSPYTLSQNMDEDVSEAPASREALFRELIGFRLAHGFQLVVGPALVEFLGPSHTNLIRIFDEKEIAKDGATVFMTVGGTIHQLTCNSEGEIEVRRYNRKPSAAVGSMTGPRAPPYRPYIRTLLDKSYQIRDIKFREPRSEYNWNPIDTFLAGHFGEFSETLRFWRARFVLIPVDVPVPKGRNISTVSEDLPEEIRLDGIKKLTQMWQRNRVLPPEERYQSRQRRKDPNPLAIEYQTRDPSAVIAAGLDSHTLNANEASANATNIFTEDDTHVTKSVDLHKLAQEIQGDGGIKIEDRRWHLKLYNHCFVGTDLTSWLLQKFRDIDTRDDAVEFGNELMTQGLFTHVQKRHNFRDGQYFYMIANDYRVARPDMKTSWFSTRRFDRSVPSTPMTDGPRQVSTDKSYMRPNTSTSSQSGQFEGEKTPIMKPANGGKRRVNLSHVMKYDVDFRHKSYRSEHIDLHYDRLHNPDNAYHIRINWMNVTAKFIEDAIASWATTVDRYGLKLVEVPIAEACTIAEHHPFRSPYIIKLAQAPPSVTLPHYFDTSASSAPHTHMDRFFYQKAILRKLNFVLDIEATSSYPNDVEVMFSWGKPDYKLAQYIHRSGIVLAQITEEGNFLLLANRLYNNRAYVGREGIMPAESLQHERRPPSSGQALLQQNHPTRIRSPMSSPLTRPIAAAVDNTWQPSTTASAYPQQTSEDIKDIFEAFCNDIEGLKAFYEETAETKLTQIASPSPRVPASLSMTGPDSSVPSLRLPSSLTYGKGNKSSPLSARRNIQSPEIDSSLDA